METNVILQGDCLSRLKELPDDSIDAVICDPPYGLEFMGKEWDRLWDKRKDTEDAKLKGTDNIRNAPNYKAEIQAQEFHNQWAKECLRVLKPGGHLLAFGGSRTYHRLACGIEDAGFEIRDQIMWIYGSGFPKSMNIGKAIDKMLGNEREVIGERKAHDIRGNALMEATVPEFKKENNTFNYQFTKGNTEWEGWGTGLKPAHEPIVIARKPISEKNVALNVLKHGTGGINIEESRIGIDKHIIRGGGSTMNPEWGFNEHSMRQINKEVEGRFPANIILECTCANLLDEQSGNSISKDNIRINNGKENDCILGKYGAIESKGYNDEGGASRYFKNIHEEGCPCSILNEQSGISKSKKALMGSSNENIKSNNIYGTYMDVQSIRGHNDFGGASRFFYCAKASKSERNYGCEELPLGEAPGSKRSEPAEGRQSALGKPRTNFHPTVKPIKLMEYLVKLVTKEGAIVLDPFLGSGTTAVACIKLNRNWIGIEKNKEYIEIANARIKPYLNQTKLPKLNDVGVCPVCGP